MNASRLVTLLLVFVLAACSGSNGSNGANGAPGLDTGSIAGTVKDSSGAAVAGASISTAPSTTTVQTDSAGNFTLASIPIGAYTLTASKTGYLNAQLSAVGVAAGTTDQVTLTLTTALGTTGSISGTVLGRQGSNNTSAPVAGAAVCLEVTTALACTTSQSDGTFSLTGVSPGPVFLSANATGWLAGETRTAVFVAAGGTATGVSITLSGSPSPTATYVGADRCASCHTLFDAGLTAAWQHSAHAMTVVHGLNQLDVTGWPAAPADCTAANIADSGVQATEPVSGNQQEVLLVRWGANCAGQPQFSMAFDANSNGKVDAGETVMVVQGTQGGVATDAGQCGQGGLLPTAAFNTKGVLTAVPCSANFLASGPTAGQGYWQQEYLVNIGPGAAKPSWVTWDTSGAPKDMLALPISWNQRGQYWANAPDYNPTRGGTYAAVCAGCHETGPSLTVDASGNVATYVAGSQNIGCERCHGPGSDHVNNKFDAKLIINPAYLPAQAQNEMCGQCHSNGVASAQPAGTFDFAWNSQATTGGGNFIPGLHKLADFAQLPAYGDPSVYWAGGVFTNLDHMTFIDVIASTHNTNPYEKVTCVDCHDSHSVAGGPYQFARAESQTGNQFAFQANGAVLLNDVLCLACHATHGDFANVALADAARYHVSQGGTVLMNGVAWTVAATDQATSAQVIADAVNAHMLAKAGMPAYFDPMGTINGQPVGRCSSCHMMKTGWTANFLFSGPDAYGRTADIGGDVSSHVFKVATAGDAALSVPGAATWDAIMPSSCGSCHVEYRLGK
jgi:hypothetical protein